MQYKRLIIFILVLIFLGVLSVYYPYLTGEIVKKQDIEYEREQVSVTRVIDGDTVETDNGTVRLLGVNTPERGKKYYKEAKDFLKQIENKTIEILRDKDDEDKYERKLRYIFFDGRLLNVEILELGLGTSFMLDDLKYEGKLKSGEEFARESGSRLWEGSEDICADCIKLIELDYENEFFILENKCSFDCDLSGWYVKDNANHFITIIDLDAGENRKFESKGSIWNNDGDRFFMRDSNEKLVVFYEY